MTNRISAAVAIALLVIAPLTVSRAQATGAMCNDGTTSTAVGKGACSGHGGLKTATKASPTAQSKTTAVKPANKTKTVTPDTKTKPATKSEASMAKPETKGASKTKPASTKSDTKVTKADTKPATKTPPAASKKTASAGDKDPKDATAVCKDGTYSHAASHTGACSGHGGVEKFLK